MRSESNTGWPSVAVALAFSALIVGTTIFQVWSSRSDLNSGTLRRGRVVLGSGMPSRSDWPLIQGDGSPSHLLDGDLEAPSLLANPSPHREGMHWLVDLALTHWPPVPPRVSPRRRQPGELVIYNGHCTACPDATHRMYPRIKTARLEILERRSNDPDVEFVIPEAHPVYIKEIELPDRPGPVHIPLPLPPALVSTKYPEHVFYIIAKITPHELYVGTHSNSVVPLAEVQYGDWDVDEAALQKGGPFHYWK